MSELNSKGRRGVRVGSDSSGRYLAVHILERYRANMTHAKTAEVQFKCKDASPYQVSHTLIRAESAGEWGHHALGQALRNGNFLSVAKSRQQKWKHTLRRRRSSSLCSSPVLLTFTLFSEGNAESVTSEFFIRWAAFYCVLHLEFKRFNGGIFMRPHNCWAFTAALADRKDAGEGTSFQSFWIKHQRAQSDLVLQWPLEVNSNSLPISAWNSTFSALFSLFRDEANVVQLLLQ